MLVFSHFENIDKKNLKTNKLKTKTEWLQAILILILLLLCFWLYYKSVRAEEKLDETNEMYKDASKETLFYKNKYGESVALSHLVGTQKVSDFVDAIFSDPAMIALQKAVKENGDKIKKGGSVTYITSKGEIDKEVPSDVYVDPVTKDTAFTSSFEDKWITYDTKATKKSTKLNLTYRDEYEVVIGREKDSTLSFFKRLFSEPESKVWVTSKSPYNKIENMKAYQVKDQIPSRWSVGVTGSYGYDLREVRLVPHVGIGVSYRLFYIGKGKTEK